jgi:hypothetical protein
MKSNYRSCAKSSDQARAIIGLQTELLIHFTPPPNTQKPFYKNWYVIARFGLKRIFRLLRLRFSSAVLSLQTKHE